MGNDWLNGRDSCRMLRTSVQKLELLDRRNKHRLSHLSDLCYHHIGSQIRAHHYHFFPFLFWQGWPGVPLYFQGDNSKFGLIFYTFADLLPPHLIYRDHIGVTFSYGHTPFQTCILQEACLLQSLIRSLLEKPFGRHRQLVLVWLLLSWLNISFVLTFG